MGALGGGKHSLFFMLLVKNYVCGLRNAVICISKSPQGGFDSTSNLELLSTKTQLKSEMVWIVPTYCLCRDPYFLCIDPLWSGQNSSFLKKQKQNQV